MKKKIVMNSPVVLSFAGISGLALLLGYVTGGASTRMFFTCYQSRLTDPLFYLRLFTHVLGHANFQHYLGNMMYFLLLGPILEEKYGSKRLLEIIGLTAVVTGVVHVLVSPTTGLLGASGVVFAFILLASVTGTKSDEIPFTMILIAVLYIGQQVIDVFTADDVSQLTHIIGGAVGGIYGLSMRSRR